MSITIHYGERDMGCDIHLYSETKKNGKWVADFADEFSFEKEGDSSYPDLPYSYHGGRDYYLFGLLNNDVRSTWDWSFKERGMPEDASIEITSLAAHDGVDGHSHSYLSVPELKAKATELLLYNDEAAKYLCGVLSKLIHDLPASTDPENQRIVFWFDN